MFADLKAAWAAASDDNIGILAAGIAHYALLALVPALGALVLAYGLFVDGETVAAHIALLAQSLPASAAGLIGDQLRSVSDGPANTQGLGLVLSLAIAVFGARSGARSLMTGLDLAFNLSESRGFIGGNLVALAITFAGVAGLVVAGIGAASLGQLGGLAGSIVSLVFLAVLASGAAALLYRYAPSERAAGWSAIWPGAIGFAVLWLGATAAFGFYAANFGSYNATYGALGAVLALINWFWVSGYALLLGAELVEVRQRSR